MHPPHIEKLKGWERLAAIASLSNRASARAARRVIIKRFMRMTGIDDHRKLVGIFRKEWLDEFNDVCDK